MEKLAIDLIKISLVPEGMAVKIKIPKFVEENTYECKKDMQELDAMANELGHKLGDMLNKYNPKRKAPKNLEDSLLKVIEALAESLSEED